MGPGRNWNEPRVYSFLVSPVALLAAVEGPADPWEYWKAACGAMPVGLWRLSDLMVASSQTPGKSRRTPIDSQAMDPDGSPLLPCWPWPPAR